MASQTVKMSVPMIPTRPIQASAAVVHPIPIRIVMVRPDCKDKCPDDPDKTDPGECGCGTPDNDPNSDGMADCDEDCPDDPDKTDPGHCGCGTPDTDTDRMVRPIVRTIVPMIPTRRIRVSAAVVELMTI